MRVDTIIIRATLQAASPLMIASGEQDTLTDNMLARDWNGLPMLPATSLAGALRAAAGDRANTWFGWAEGDDGERSAVMLTDGLFCWADGSPRDGLLLHGEAANDDLAKSFLPAAPPLVRHHVQLNEEGTVDGVGKFERSAVPTGARFTFEVRLADTGIADKLEALIRQGLWLGGATRAGYGRMECKAIRREDISLPEGWLRWQKVMQADISSDRGVPERALPAQTVDAPSWRVVGQIEGPLLIGMDSDDRAVDRQPWAERQISWQSGRGVLGDPVYVIPGSAIKGPVRHRTLFFLRKLLGDRSKGELDNMFGVSSETEGARAGKLRFCDCAVPDSTPIIDIAHVGLDRFTGGARRGVLFADRMLWRPMLSIRIEESCGLTPDQHAALSAALDDLRKGLCGIGAEWGEGAGIFGSGTAVFEPGDGEGQTDAA